MNDITGEILISVEVTEDDLREVFNDSRRKDAGLKFDSLTGWVDGAIDGNHALQDYAIDMGLDRVHMQLDYGELDVADFCEWLIDQCPEMPEEEQS